MNTFSLDGTLILGLALAVATFFIKVWINGIIIKIDTLSSMAINHSKRLIRIETKLGITEDLPRETNGI